MHTKTEYWLLQKTLCGLRCSSCDWYECIDSILLSISLTPNPNDPCFYTEFVHDKSNILTFPLTVPLSLGLYLDDFVYFLEDPAVEAKFECLLNEHATVAFMGTVEWFLGTHFQWTAMSKPVQVHLSHTGFASHLTKKSNIHLCNVTPNATPHRSTYRWLP